MLIFHGQITPVIIKYVIHVIGERAKRARCYLLVSMESRDIYIYMCTSVSNTHARMTYVCF